jgi:hypothetical protein
MKTLYHGSIDIVKEPEIRVPNRRLDFGSGFYLTSSLKQAQDWVLRKLSNEGKNIGYVNSYSFDDDNVPTNLNIKVFSGPSEDWLDFVMSNRRETAFVHDYDIVVGPVANDRVYTAFSLYEGGIIDKSTLIKELQTYRLVDQYLFHTSKALDYLIFNSIISVSK